MRKTHVSGRHPGRHPLRGLGSDRRGVAVIEAVFVLPPFLSLLFLILVIGVYFTFQSSLDVGFLESGDRAVSDNLLLQHPAIYATDGSPRRSAAASNTATSCR